MQGYQTIQDQYLISLDNEIHVIFGNLDNASITRGFEKSRLTARTSQLAAAFALGKLVVTSSKLLNSSFNIEKYNLLWAE